MADLTGYDTAARMRGEQYQQKVFVWNGKNRLRKYDGVNWNKAGIEPYPFVPATAAGGTGLLDGTYQYVCVAVNENNRNKFGQVTSAIPSFLSRALTVSLKIVNLSGIPATHPDPQVTHWHIFRNKNGELDSDVSTEDLDLFYVGKVAIGTTTFADNMEDDALTGAERARFNCAPPATFKYGAIFGDRLFGGGFDPISTGTVTKADKTIDNKAMTSNVATLQTTASHGYSAGDWVCIDIGDPLFDGAQKIIAVPSGTTFTFHVDTAITEENVASGAASGTAQKITFSSDMPDGIEGCILRISGESKEYRVARMNSATSVALTEVHSGALSGASFTLYRPPWEIYISELGDCEASGEGSYESEGLRWKKELPGRDQFIGCIVYNGRLLIFGASNIYAIEGKGANLEDIRIAPDPYFAGLGAVSGDAIFRVDDECHFMSLRGPAVLKGDGAPVLYGQKLLTDWLDGLTQAEQALITCFGFGFKVWYWFPVSGETENSRGWRYERDSDSWWEEDGAYPKFGFIDDGDGGAQSQVYFVQNQYIFQPDYSTTDAVPTSGTPYTGLVTSGSTTTVMQASGASFPTSNGGLAECVVCIYDTTTGALKGARRIVSNTATSITWSSSGSGGGTLSYATGDTYEIGYIPWSWKTKSIEMPGHRIKAAFLDISFGSIDDTKSIRTTKYVDGTAETYPLPVFGKEIQRRIEEKSRNADFAVKFESRNQAVLRHAVIEIDAQGGQK